MEKINGQNELNLFRKSVLDKRNLTKPCIMVCASTGCRAFGAQKIIQAFRDELEKRGLEKIVDVKVTGCHGFCERGPLVVIEPQGIFYPSCKPGSVPEIISKTVLKGEIIEDLLYVDPVTGERICYEKDVPFYKGQKRLVLANCGKIDPKSIEEYIEMGGYNALSKALSGMSPGDVIDEIKRSGLRGRGGAGFPTGLKWEIASKQQGDVKYVICNADEGDPGAYMDRSVLESNPHSVIEGMMIGARAIGATEGWVYARNEYPMAVEHIKMAIEQAKEFGFLGENILGSDFSFNIKIAKGAGAFVCGEETALIASIEGKKGIPRQRPPFPAQSGLFGKPTNINNVETWANIPIIIDKGGDWYAGIGTETSKGAKIFSLVGKVRNSGLVEVPMGTTIAEIVFDIGGGAPKGRKVKAVQIGGPSGGCIPLELFHLPVDYESLKSVGAIMGSGGMIVMDENSCMVDIAKYFENFLQDESCGKCSTCREGTQRMHEILSNITEVKGKKEDLDLLEELGGIVKAVSMCGLGQTAPNPVLATLRFFRDEYTDHIEKMKCSAAVCTEIVSSPCQHTCPIDTEAGVYIALIANRRFEEALSIIKKDNPLASVLARVCSHPCEDKCRAGDGGDPISIRDLKRFVTDYGLRNKLQLKAGQGEDDKGIKVAIVGSGPAGLTCGFYLAQKGYDVTIFEKQPVAGGMLAIGIPEYRLPKKILNTDIDYIKSAGVKIRTNYALGKDFQLRDLFDRDYKAIFLALGAHKSLKLNVPGEDAEGIMHEMDVLTALNLGKEVEIGGRVGIIGGGNAAVDVARSILRTGKAENVTIFYRRTIAEMPAYKEEVEQALKEGIKIEFLTALKKIITENGKLKAIEFKRMKLGERDGSGRRSPVPIEGSEHLVELDALVVSISERPDISAFMKENLVFSKWDTLPVDPETFRTRLEEVFAGGDLVTGPNRIINAAASGKIASRSIDQYLSGKEVKREYRLTRPSMYIEPLELSDEEMEELLSAKRPQMASLSIEDRKFNYSEVEYCLTEEQAIKEAKRCLRCDLETKDGQSFLEKLKKKTAPEEEGI